MYSIVSSKLAGHTAKSVATLFFLFSFWLVCPVGVGPLARTRGHYRTVMAMNMSKTSMSQGQMNIRQATSNIFAGRSSVCAGVCRWRRKTTVAGLS